MTKNQRLIGEKYLKTPTLKKEDELWVSLIEELPCDHSFADQYLVCLDGYRNHWTQSGFAHVSLTNQTYQASNVFPLDNDTLYARVCAFTYFTQLLWYLYWYTPRAWLREFPSVLLPTPWWPHYFSILLVSFSIIQKYNTWIRDGYLHWKDWT